MKYLVVLLLSATTCCLAHPGAYGYNTPVPVPVVPLPPPVQVVPVPPPVQVVPLPPPVQVLPAAPVVDINLPVASEVVVPDARASLAFAHPASFPLQHAAPVLVHERFAPVAPLAAPVFAPVSVPSSQFHAQDELGGFSFGYSNANSAKNEIRTPDGVTRGFYEYVDANNIVQRVEYIADPINGFRVVGTNLPVNSAVVGAPVAVAVAPVAVADTAEVVAAKADFQRAFDAAVVRNLKKRSASAYEVPVVLPPVLPAPVRLVHQPSPWSRPPPPPLPVPLPLVAQPIQPAFAPIAVAPQPLALPLAVTPVDAFPASQFHAQDELGGVSFGYQNANSARQEVRLPDGTTQGSYSYVDGNGLTQTVHYIADALGFRVAGTNLPVA